MKIKMLIPFLLLAGLAPAQQVKWNFDKLAARADDTTDVNLDGSMLRLAAKFLSNDDGDQAQVRKLIVGLKGIYVKSFEFKNAGEYSKEDIEGFRAELRNWSRIVNTHSRGDGENTEVYVKSGANDAIEGLAIISAEPKELTLVNIVGTINLDDLSALSGHFGVPEVDLGDAKKK